MGKEKETVWSRNFADDEDLAEKTAAYFVSQIRVARTNRLPLEEAWWRFFNQWNVTKDGYHDYIGRAQLFIPEVRKNVEAQARQLTKSAFPSEDCFDVSPNLTGSRKGALAWKSYHTWGMRNCGLMQKYFVAMRQEVMLGTTPIYLPWRRDVRHQFRSRKEKGQIIPKRQEVELFNGPDFIVRDLFRWYTFNPKKKDLSDGCFEITAVSSRDLDALERQGLCANAERIKASSQNAYMNEEFSRDVMRAQSEGIQIQYNTASAGTATISSDGDEDGYKDTLFMRTIIFADMVFPEACEKGEDPTIPIPMMVDIYGNNVCGLIQRNPFYHQSPPYVVGRYIAPNADEFYGQGIPWAIQFMQYELNTKAEQGMDSTTLALNPIAIIDPGLAGASNEFNVEPGAIWWANPAGVKLAAMPDVSPVAYQAINQLRSQMADYSDRSPALPPELLGKSRSATQSGIVFDTLGVDNWLFQMQNEVNILSPMLEQWESISDQNLKDKQIVMILGRRAGDFKRTLLSKSDILGKYSYSWKGASASANKAIISRQMLDGMKVLASLPPQAMGQINFNYGEFFKVLYTEMWNLPDADKILGMPEEMAAQDAECENEMSTMGLELEVLPSDDDKGHMQSHDAFMQKPGVTKESKLCLASHIIEHKKADQMKAQMAQQQAQQQQQQMQMNAQAYSQLKLLQEKGKPTPAVKQLMQQQGGVPQTGGPSASGNRTQLSSNGNLGDMGSGQRG